MEEEYSLYDEKNAPKDSQDALIAAKAKYGFIPNLLGYLAESPAALHSYMQLASNLEHTTFTPEEQQALYLSVSYENECHYCMAAHSGGAAMVKMSEETLNALRNGVQLENPKINTLVDITRKLVKQSGWIEKQDIQTFLHAGYSKANLLEVLMVVAQKTISNYANHILKTPLDESFKGYQWAKN